MKKWFIFTLFLVGFTSLFAQKFEKVKALKTAYITDRLNLTSAEAEKFWPVYNQYEKELNDLQMQDRKEIHELIDSKGGVEKLTEKESAVILQKAMDLQHKIHQTQQNKFVALKKILPSSKILKLIKAEESFKRELFRMLQERREERGKR